MLFNKSWYVYFWRSQSNRVFFWTLLGQIVGFPVETNSQPESSDALYTLYDFAKMSDALKVHVVKAGLKF